MRRGGRHRERLGGEDARARKEARGPLISRSGPLAKHNVLIVGVPESEVEAMLKRGVGPVLTPGARCPACGGELGRWGSYRRWVRRAEKFLSLRLSRAICRACRRTHALLPSFLFARRIDIAEAIFGALEMGARGRGHRAAAAGAGVPETTARSWLRRARRRAPELRAGFLALAFELGSRPARSPPAPSPLAALTEAIGLAHRAARERFGVPATLSPAAFSVAASGGLALANTSPPLAAAPRP